ncbi:nucleic acid-binding protein [uncultured Methanoregula sp.]|uniref:nucleic acid-binding protein n=1 Tax=uncultured Methanoregula sp. TaxID=1005933 RepID=UPI002AAC2471|nr:nucleic acid-binding protein [uncultured Methanoregula sp.]
MLFHYALVDDLISKEDFERRVEAKIDDCGDLVDEPTAAMMVVGELGREHVKIRGLSAKSSLFSFFGKVVDKTDPKEFDRADGEKGWVATLLLGDETGATRVVLWDEKAGAALDTGIGEVLEVIGRHPGKSTKEIYALALRKASCEISCAVPAGAVSLSNEPVELDVVLLAVEPLRTFTKRDESTGEMIEAIIGDAEGTARVVAWVPELLRELPAGTPVHITNAKPNNRSEGRNFSLDEKSTVVVASHTVTVPFAPLSSVSDQGIYSVKGQVKQMQQPRSFTTKAGTASWVRNLLISDGNDELKIVLWGENALVPLNMGDLIEAYHATAKPGRFGGIELGVGRGSAFRIPDREARPITFSGTILAGPGCLFIDNGRERYLIEGSFSHGDEITVKGNLSGSRIIPESVEPVIITAADLLVRIQTFRQELQP